MTGGVRPVGAARADLNGEVGLALRFDESAGRWLMRLRNGDGKLVKPANLEAVGGDGGGGGGDGGGGGGGGGGGSGDGRNGDAEDDKSARVPDRHRRLRRFVFASGGVPVQAHQMVLTVGTFVTQKQFPASTAAAAIAAAAAAAAAAAERDATEMTEEEEEAAAAVSSTHSLFAPPGYGTELKAGAYTRPLLSSPKPFWSHLPVSPCLIDWGKIMHPTYPTKCAYVEPKGGRV